MKRYPWVLASLAVPALALSVASFAGRGLAQSPAGVRSRLATADVRAGRPLALPQGLAPATTTPSVNAPRAPSPYQVTERAGPWMILAASCTGAFSADLAEQMVRQLRQQHRLPAYVWSFSDQKRHQEEEEYNQRMKANPNMPFRRRYTRMQEHWGVLIGGYSSSEDAHKALLKVKQLPSPDIYLPSGERALSRMNVTGERQNKRTKRVERQSAGEMEVNPYQRAFVIHNPAVPREQTNPTADDPLLKELNDGRPYNLLRCKKKWTLVVKFYQGAGMLQQAGTRQKEGGIIDQLFGDKSRKILDAGTTQAENMAKFLRQIRSPFNFEAYVLHTRNGSLVTIGGFDSLEDPACQAAREKIGRLRLHYDGGQPLDNMHQLFDQPMPMQIPRP
jgi:hypothetical protein